MQEKSRLQAYVRPQFFVGRPCRKQLRIRSFIVVQFANAQPLVGETLGEIESLLLAQHPRDERANHLRLVKLSRRRDIEQQFVRHAAPEEIGHAGSERVSIQPAKVGGGIRRFGQKQKTWRDQRGAQGEQNGGLEIVAALAGGAEQRQVFRYVFFGYRAAERSWQKRFQNLPRSLVLRNSVAGSRDENLGAGLVLLGREIHGEFGGLHVLFRKQGRQEQRLGRIIEAFAMDF